MTNPMRLNSNWTSTRLNDLLDHYKAESHTFVINLCGALKFAKTCEELREVFFGDSCTWVLDVNYEKMLWLVAIRDLDHDRATFCELEGILDKVHEYLSKAPCIPNQFWKLGYLLRSVWKRLLFYWEI